MESQADLYKRLPPDIFIRIDGIYYKWVLGKGWSIIAAPAHIVNWDILHEIQRKVYYPVLLAEGLVKPVQ